MKADFDPAEFVYRIGKRLVLDFEHASMAGTPSLIGTARENPARKQLDRLLPQFVSTGSGIVIDSFGARSSQQDIVFYERDFCPVYSINDTPEATFFPVEGVIATGEVKSVMDRATLFDAVNKVKSAKTLTRFSERESSGHVYHRQLGSSFTMGILEVGQYDQINNPNDQVFGFVMCKSFKNSPDAILENLCEIGKSCGFEHMPNMIISLEDGLIQHATLKDKVMQPSPLTADAFAFVPEQSRVFAYLVSELRRHAREGRTVPLNAFDRYMAAITDSSPVPRFRAYV